MIIFIPNLIHYLRSYIKDCHIFQLYRSEKPPTRHFHTGINPNYILISRLSIDLKVTPKSQKGHKYILCVIDEMTNFLIMVPVYQARSEEVGEALFGAYYNKTLYTRLHNNGPEQHVHVFTHAYVSID